jgi:hypothetical protein
MNNKVKIPVARLKQIIQEEVTRFYGEDSEDTELLDSDEEDEEGYDLEEAIITGSSDADKQAAITNVTNALKTSTPDKAVATAAAAGVPVNVKAIR